MCLLFVCENILNLYDNGRFKTCKWIKFLLQMVYTLIKLKIFPISKNTVVFL